MGTFARLLAAVLTGAVAAVVLVLAVTVPRTSQPLRLQAASVTKITPPSPQVIDGLYKSVVYMMPGGETFICILTQLPQSFPHFTIPPGYSCAEAAGSR